MTGLNPTVLAALILLITISSTLMAQYYYLKCRRLSDVIRHMIALEMEAEEEDGQVQR